MWPILMLMTVASPEQAARHEQRGVKYLLEGKLADAQRELEACVRLDAEASSCHRNLGVLFAQMDKSDASIKHYKRYVALEPYATDAERVRKMIEDATGQRLARPAAKHRAAPPVQIAPPPTEQLVTKRHRQLARELGEIARNALLNGADRRAEVVLLACIELDPTQAGCHRSLGVHFAKQDDTKKAIQHYRRYVELEPSASDAQRVRAMIADFERRR